MNRFKTDSALVLRTKHTGESNREAYFLTSSAGIIRAVVYGGPKSKLRSFVSLFHSGVLYLYHDPVRDSYKVTDFDVEVWRPGIRESYERTITGAAIAETILAGHGGGVSWREALVMANTSLNALEIADTTVTNRIFVHFLWKWAEILGVRPENSSEITLRHPGALQWLNKADLLEPSMMIHHESDELSLRYAKKICTEILTSALGRKLSGWTAL
ncbi:MAG: recombination protein O N-terminal domain-containing protein [Spirochaetaceae bacterium]|nr:recombination protein O N-terminal domain-containing protein [Spirochaetaceae bacterium]